MRPIIGTIRKMAKVKRVSARTISRGLNELGLVSRPMAQMPLLTDAQKNVRFGRSTQLISCLKKLPKSTVHIFSDKKNFTVDQAYNRCNDRVVIKKGAPVPVVSKTKHPAHITVLGVVGSDGQKCPLHFFEKGMRMTSKDYIKVMSNHGWRGLTLMGTMYSSRMVLRHILQIKAGSG